MKVNGVLSYGTEGDRKFSSGAPRLADPVSNFPRRATEHLQKIPVISLDPKETETSRLARVAFCTATYGINVGGTVYRMDDVPITLRVAFDSAYPSDETVLSAIKDRLAELLAEKRGYGALKKAS
jgi:formylmethanofuran dehydrogenase subunit B